MSSFAQGNSKRVKYWAERLTHFMDELNKIDRIIIELKREAVRGESDRALT